MLFKETTDKHGKAIFTNERGDIAYIADQHVENYVMSQERGIAGERMKIVACPFIDGEVIYSEAYTDPSLQRVTVEPIMDFTSDLPFVEAYPLYRFSQYVNAFRKLMAPVEVVEVGPEEGL